ELYLKKIDTSRLSEAGIASYNKIESFFKHEYPGFESDLIDFGFTVNCALEGYYKTNKDIDWVYPYQKRKAFIDIPFGFGVGDYITVASSLSAAQNIKAMISHDNYVNVPFPASKFDINFPHNAYGSMGCMFSEETGINFRIARGYQSIGNSSTGSVILSDYCSNESYAELSVFSPKYRYASNVTELNPPKGKEGNPDPLYMYLHRLEFRFMEKLTFTLLEGVCVNAPLELRFLNPLMVVHGFASWNDYYGSGNNPDKEIVKKEASLLAANLNYVPCPGVKLYFLYAMNQFQTGYERKNWPDLPIPNAIALQGGMDLAFPLKNGYLCTTLEGVYATPYMYLMECSDCTYIREYRENIGLKNVREWVGTPFGPDSISAFLSVGYKVPGQWSAFINYVFSAQGEHSDTSIVETDYWPVTMDKATMSAPSGIPQYSNIISLKGLWNITDRFSLAFSPSYVFLFNAGNQKGVKRNGFEFSASCSYSLF
ncbi:MAG: hypothetical protein IKZ04_04120, partial [Spirochaetaceae bacterium]|nr:hypothetical protein [Spirochaetaceae bacterium]